MCACVCVCVCVCVGVCVYHARAHKHAHTSVRFYRTDLSFVILVCSLILLESAVRPFMQSMTWRHINLSVLFLLDWMFQYLISFGTEKMSFAPIQTPAKNDTEMIDTELD